MGQPDLGSVDEPRTHVRPDLVGTKFTDYWVYVAGHLTGAAIAVGFAGTAEAAAAPLQPSGRWIPRSNGPHSHEQPIPRGHHWPKATRQRLLGRQDRET